MKPIKKPRRRIGPMLFLVNEYGQAVLRVPSARRFYAPDEVCLSRRRIDAMIRALRILREWAR